MWYSRYIKWIVPVLLGFVLGVLCGFICSQQVLLNRIQKEIQSAKNLVVPYVPPYYSADSFVKPADILTSSSSASMRIPIIMYHHVDIITDENDEIRKKITISPGVFERQLREIRKEGYESYFVRDIPNLVSGFVVTDSPVIVLTFDDGYDDFYRVVYPLLKKYHMRATLYVIVEYVGKKGFVTQSQLLEMVKSDLVEIGSHTLNHAYLKNTSSRITRIQLTESKRVLDEMLGISTQTIAYPYGAFTAETEALVKEASYSASVSVISGQLQSKDNLFYLSRIRAGTLAIGNIRNILDEFSK